MANIICFDLEGPLSPQDNAYEVMGLFENGLRVFEVISRYDDILALEGREGYEPGDTLSLILPFLVYHKVRENDIRLVSESARIVDGVPYTIDALGGLGWDEYIISTSYQQHAYNIAAKIGVAKDKVYCTKLALDGFVNDLKNEEAATLIGEAEAEILRDLYPALDDSKKIKERLDRFFWKDLAKTALGRFMNEVKVVGGQRKLDAVQDILNKNGASPRNVFAVGDSITDYKMLASVDSWGGVSVAFNGNQYSVPYATVGLASTDMRMMLVLIAAWMRGGREEVSRVAKDWEDNREKYQANPANIPQDIAPDHIKTFLMDKAKDGNFMWPYIHSLNGSDEKRREAVIKIHKKARALVRGDAAKLG